MRMFAHVVKLPTWWRVRVRKWRRKRPMTEFAPRLEREAEASAMLPHTQFGRGVAVMMTLAFLVPMIFLLPARFWHPAAGNSASGGGDPGGGNPALSAVAKPAPVTDSLEQARPRTQQFLTKYLGGGNSQVQVGLNGWLFYHLGIDHVIGPGFLTQQHFQQGKLIGFQNDPRPSMIELRDGLKKRGINLLLLPIPDKLSIYPEQLSPAYDAFRPAPQNLSHEQWKRDMQAAGIPVFDPTDILMAAKATRPELLYVPTDSHWTPRAAQVCAAGLAAWIRSCRLVPDDGGGTTYLTKPSSTLGPHDLVGLLGLPDTQTLYHRAALPMREVHDANGQFFRSDPDADVLIIGDSFAGFYEGAGASLAAQLAFELKRPVQYISIPNGGSWAARFDLHDRLVKHDSILEKKKLVIWEFTARDLSSGDWKPCPLPAVAPPPAAAAPYVASEAARTGHGGRGGNRPVNHRA